MKNILYIILLVFSSSGIFAQHKITGKIVSGYDQHPLENVSVLLKGSTVSTRSNTEGIFKIDVTVGGVMLTFSHIGYQSQEIRVRPGQDSLTISMEPADNLLKEVKISTGYQEIPQERSTGSFVQIDNNLLNRRVGTDILSRLQDVTSGLSFNNVGASKISIRGQSTLFSNANPLIIIDNFPFDGDINNINPNDVESISVLKDAAASSIWGARAGNGVIVVTTKKGRYNEPPKISFNSNVTIGQKPDQFYIPQMSSADYIEVEKKLFAQGFYTATETDVNKAPITPVIELLIAARDGKITAGDANDKIEAFKNIDIRNDYDRYLNRKSVNQQYALNISGGSERQRYFISGGWDKNLASAVGNQYGRYTLNASNSYMLIPQKLTFTSAVYYTQNQTIQDALSSFNLNLSATRPVYPYARFADDQGNALAITHDYRASFIQTSATKGLLDWAYRPLDELKNLNNITKSKDYRINLGLHYNIIRPLSFDLLYQYGGTLSSYRNLQSQDTYYTRNQINRLTKVNTDGSLTRPIPLGGIIDLSNGEVATQNFRVQANFNKTIANDHQLDMIAGSELRDSHSLSNSYRLYGYDDEHATSKLVDYISSFTSFVNPSSTNNKIPNADGMSDLTDRYISYYANAAYSYKRRYTFSASGRLDQSNLFGVNTNQKGVPLYSAGLSWLISDEGFYKAALLPYLRMRVTYGYSGNINKSLSAYTTATYFSPAGSTINQNYATIKNPPNPELRWERISMVNLAVDFKFIRNILSGSVEYYFKKGIDLIGNIPYAPQTGITSFTGNTANIKGRGIDLTLNSHNLDGKFKWYSDFLFSYAQDEVTRYTAKSSNVASDYLLSGNPIPTEGKPYYGIYSYPWAGLDPLTGDPQGYLNGVVSKNYSAIKAAATTTNLVYNGSARPVFFGSFRNTFSYRQFAVSANISYQLDYYVRRSSVNYGTVLNGNGGHSDYALRWQQPGDEAITNVPSIPSAINSIRDEFYTYSAILVDKGDHIRLQDLNLSYDLSKAMFKRLPVNHIQLYFYANNLGLIWKAAKGNLDLDYQTIYSLPPVRTFSIGLKTDF